MIKDILFFLGVALIIFLGSLAALDITTQEIVRICLKNNITCVDNCSTSWVECSGGYCFGCSYNMSKKLR